MVRRRNILAHGDNVYGEKMEKSKEINYKKMPVPSSPGAQQITNENLQAKKGSADMNSKLPKENMVPGSNKNTSK